MDKSIKITIIICITAFACVALFLIFNPFKGSKTETTVTQEQLKDKNSTTSVTTKETQKDERLHAGGESENKTKEPLPEQADNGGVKVPDNVPISITDKPTERTGVSFTPDKSKVFIYAEKNLIDEVRKGTDGGNVKEPNKPPQCQGSYPDGETMEDMVLQTIDGKELWTTAEIDAATFLFLKNCYCIYLGKSKAGNWGKYLHDEYKRQGKGKLPGSLSNNVGGMNGWFYAPDVKK